MKIRNTYIHFCRQGENMRTASRSLNSRCPHAARSRYSPPVCHDSISGHQVSYQRFWENRWIPDSLPTGQRPRRKPPHVEPTLIKVKRHLPSAPFSESHSHRRSRLSVSERTQPSITRFARLNKQRSGDLSLFRSKVIRLQLAMPLGHHRGRMIAFATAVRSGPSALRGPLD